MPNIPTIWDESLPVFPFSLPLIASKMLIPYMIFTLYFIDTFLLLLRTVPRGVVGDITLRPYTTIYRKINYNTKYETIYKGIKIIMKTAANGLYNELS